MTRSFTRKMRLQKRDEFHQPSVFTGPEKRSPFPHTTDMDKSSYFATILPHQPIHLPGERNMMVRVEIQGTSNEMAATAESLGQLLGYEPNGEVVRQILGLLQEGKTVELAKQNGMGTYKITPRNSTNPPA
jgi:hypothetical protein